MKSLIQAGTTYLRLLVFIAIGATLMVALVAYSPFLASKIKLLIEDPAAVREVANNVAVSVFGTLSMMP